MMFMIPLAMIATIIVTMMAGLNGSNNVQDTYGAQLGENMLLQHEAALEEMASRNLWTGSFGKLVKTPFVSMGNWRSQIVRAGNRRMVVTWSNGSDGLDDQKLAEATAHANGMLTRRNVLSHAGPYINNGSSASVGGTDIRGFTFPVPAGRHVVVSVYEGG